MLAPLAAISGPIQHRISHLFYNSAEELFPFVFWCVNPCVLFAEMRFAKQQEKYVFNNIIALVMFL